MGTQESQKAWQTYPQLSGTSELSLEDVARRTSLSVDFLKALEEEDVTPSIWPLLKVALALGQRLGTFMDDDVDGDVCITRRAERGGDATTFGNGRGNSASFVYHSLGSAKTDRHMEPFSIEIRPDEKAQTEKTPSSHEGEEFIAVIAGELEVLLGPERHVLGPGDTIYYNSVVPHYVGCGNAPHASIYAVSYLPE